MLTMTMTANPPESSTRIAVVADASRWELAVDGELDLHSGPELVDVAMILASYRVPVVELDLRGVGFVDIAGWRAVEESLDILATAGTVATVRRCSEPVQRFRALFAQAGSAA